MRVVLPGVAQHNNGHGQVEQRLARSVVTVKVGSLVLAPGSSGLLGGRGGTLGELLVERNNLLHSLGVGVGAQVLDS